MGNKHYYSVNELYCSNKQKLLCDASAAAFLLGGIGTGNVSVGARGELRSWQIFNEPGQFNFLPYTFFALRAEVEGGEAVSKILESKLNPPFTHPEGTLRCELGGLPRFEKIHDECGISFCPSEAGRQTSSCSGGNGSVYAVHSLKRR